ncbi:hypothetical protein [Nocardia sp. alder85J]|uniref:hypothetical protein n=1 Tax=Nocardia sp. alder85J TaxID=2862949 RepID=UPI001CD7A88D|nr:hypothetical protein [Nocardia sp. alder85J]MCX4092314.1 hypothetical protein [Nocardia sp. alder85J]
MTTEYDRTHDRHDTSKQESWRDNEFRDNDEHEIIDVDPVPESGHEAGKPAGDAAAEGRGVADAGDESLTDAEGESSAGAEGGSSSAAGYEPVTAGADESPASAGYESVAEEESAAEHEPVADAGYESVTGAGHESERDVVSERSSDLEPETDAAPFDSEPTAESERAGDTEPAGLADAAEAERSTGSGPAGLADAEPGFGAAGSAATADAPKPVAAQTPSGLSADALFAITDIDRLRTQFRELQGTFVDDPRDAVTKADELVTETIQQLTTVVSERKRSLEGRWSHGADEAGDTEDLRQALRGYRAFLDQLLTVGQ